MGLSLGVDCLYVNNNEVNRKDLKAPCCKHEEALVGFCAAKMGLEPFALFPRRAFQRAGFFKEMARAGHNAQFFLTAHLGGVCLLLAHDGVVSADKQQQLRRALWATRQWQGLACHRAGHNGADGKLAGVSASKAAAPPVLEPK